MSLEQNRFLALIADDEPLARERMVSLLNEIKDSVGIAEIKEFEHGLQAFEYLSESHGEKSLPVIAFLDIQMPFMNGLELAHHLGKMRKPPAIVFVTAHDQHAVEAFEQHALDYILKPARVERIQEVFDKLTRLGKLSERFNDKHLTQAGMDSRTHLSVSERGKVRLIPIDEILYLKAELKYTTIKTGEKEYLTEEPLVGLEEEFKDRFVRIHRNCLIPRSKIRGFERNRSEESGWVAIIEGIAEKLPVSRRQWAHIRELFANH